MIDETREDKKLDSDLENKWQSCCFTADKRMIQYVVTSSISFTALLFCMGQLIFNPDSDDKAIYFSTISSIVSLHIPSPTLSKK